MNARSLIHYVSLDGAGGVELQFAEFLEAAARLTATRQATVACGRGVHPLVRERLERTGASLAYEKYAGALKLPKWPRTVRVAHQRRLIAQAGAEGVVIWNRLRDSLNTLAAAGAERCVYWERGASWFPGQSQAKQTFVDTIGAVLCNSHAARRMLELRWGYTGQLCVVPNALRPSLWPSGDVRARELPEDRPLRLGFVARLTPVKGAVLAVHALALLRDAGVDAQLRIAGDGPERGRLDALVARLELGDRVIFAGLVADMGAFYRDIDILVHPALREPFGQIAIEANAHGVPAVVAAVDGLVEVVADDISGVCLAPNADLSVYAELGGGTGDLPPYVYHPAEDAIDRPRVLEPDVLADALVALIGDRARYERLSRAAIARVRDEFDFDRHVRRALGAIDGFVTSGKLDTT